MPTLYPGGIDNFTDPAPTTPLDDPTNPHAGQHVDKNDAIEAIETELGTDPAGTFIDVKTRLNDIESKLLPAGAIILWDGASCPTGFTRVSALDGRFLVGGATYNPAAGGSDTINANTGSAGSHGHSISGSTSTASGCSSGWNAGRGTCGGVAEDAARLDHSHSAGGLSVSGDGSHSHPFSFDNRPAFATVLICKKD